MYHIHITLNTGNSGVLPSERIKNKCQEENQDSSLVKIERMVYLQYMAIRVLPKLTVIESDVFPLLLKKQQLFPNF